MPKLINSNSVHQYNYNICFWDSQCIEIHSCNNYKYIFSIKYLHNLPFLCGFHSLPEKDRVASLEKISYKDPCLYKL